jgi:WD40 repeat protein
VGAIQRATVVAPAADNADHTRRTTYARGPSQRAIRLWDVEIAEGLWTLDALDDDVCSVALTPDGSRVVSGTRSGKVEVWSAAGGQALWSAPGWCPRDKATLQRCLPSRKDQTQVDVSRLSSMLE